MERPGEETMIRFFLGKCTREEEQVISAYLALDRDKDYIENCIREAFYLQGEELDPSRSQHQRDHIWSTLTGSTKEKSSIRLKPRRQWFSYAAAAAILLLCATMGLWFKGYWNKTAQSSVGWEKIYGPAGQVKTFLLKDSSKVTLFPGSAIDVPADFNGSDRRIRLSGRAFFSIAHNRKKPFYVQAGTLTTKVLGTSFEINTTKTQNTITLHTGSISISHKDQEILRLHPDQQLQYQQESGKYKVASVHAAGTINWIRGELDYDRAALKEIVNDLEKWYGVNIHTDNPALLERRVVFSFKNQPLDRVLSLLSRSAGFSYQIKGKNISLKERSMNGN
eukprot:gene12562-14741_t